MMKIKSTVREKVSIDNEDEQGIKSPLVMMMNKGVKKQDKINERLSSLILAKLNAQALKGSRMKNIPRIKIVGWFQRKWLWEEQNYLGVLG